MSKSKNRVFVRPLPDASVPRNAFDMSKVVSLNMPFGALIPVYAHQYIAGSHLKINMRTFFRTAAVNTAAFPALKINFDWFCVPLRYLWSYWDNFKLGIQDYNSTALVRNSGSINNPTSVPSFNRYELQHYIYQNGSGTDTTWTDSVGYRWKYGAARLCDMLGYGRISPQTDITDFSTRVQAMNPFKALAYQKIYYDHFRNTAYESNYPYAYNLDLLTSAGSSIGATDLYQMFRLRYCNYRKDYFQHIFPSLNYSISQPSLPFSGVPSWVQGVVSGANAGVSGLANNNNRYGGVPRVVQAVSPSSETNFSVQSIRALFALDKLQRSSAYAPKHVKQQYEARYGIKFPSVSSFESSRIGSFDTDVIIGEVTSTANTESTSGGDSLGAIGGKGVGSSRGSGYVDYDVTEDSIVMCIAYALPRTSYDSNRFENWNMKLVQSDFFIPEYMNLGLKPLYRKEVRFNLAQNTDNDVLGYQTPYMEYKADVDENHGLFADSESDLGQFVVHSNRVYEFGSASGVTFSYFKVKPSDVDSIFVNEFDGSESTDQLFGQIEFVLPVNQNMSVHGQPSL